MRGDFFNGGGTSLTSTNSRKWTNYKVLKQDPQPWFNDSEECPIPEGLEYQVWSAGRWHKSGGLNWKVPYQDSPITAFQILGETE